MMGPGGPPCQAEIWSGRDYDTSRADSLAGAGARLAPGPSTQWPGATPVPTLNGGTARAIGRSQGGSG